MLDIKYRFTCGDSDLSRQIIKKWQYIMTRIVDEAFPNHQFTGYKMIKIDRKKHSGAIMFYINGNIP